MSSFLFVSTATAFVLRVAKPVFIDIRPDTLNIEKTKIEHAITKHTKAIVPIHYAEIACDMNTILSISKRYALFVIEDGAQGLMVDYQGKALGSIRNMGAN